MSNPASISAVKVFAPVNIAWIKYMGKNAGLPTNSSLSLTLATLGTHTSLRIDEKETANKDSTLSFEWDLAGYLPPIHGKQKVEQFLLHEKIWNDLLLQFDYKSHVPRAKVIIHTINNVPAGTGIATSASAFAALTLAWSALLAGSRQQEWIEKYQSGDVKMRKAMAMVAAKGSGSACRSFDGPWVEWSPSQGILVVDGGNREWMDFIILIESGPKEVPSSEAHARVSTSPHFIGRSLRAEKRLSDLKLILKKNSDEILKIKRLVLDEALDMHNLFHTSQPPFKYIHQLSEEIVTSSQLQKFNGVVTLDAGANVHLFVPIEEELDCEQWIKNTFPNVKYLKDITGYGARYEE